MAETFYCNYCVEIKHGDGLPNDVTYLDVHDYPTGDITENAPAPPYVAHVYQQAHYPETGYYSFRVSRVFFYFDTSSIPVDATITDVQLRFNVYQTYTTTGRSFSMVVQNGQPTYPHNPAESGDFLYSHYSGNGGEVAITSTGGKTITFTEAARDWINKGGETKLALRVDRDVDSDAPPVPDPGAFAKTEGVRIYHKSSYYARLIITYTTAEVTTEATTEIAYECAMGNGTIGTNATERGFEVKVEFAGTLNDYIHHSIADFEGDASYVIADGTWQGTLIKTESEEGDFEEGAYELVLGYPSVLGNPSSVFNDKLFKCESYTYRARATINEVEYYGDWVAFSTLCDAGAEQQPTDDISEGNPVVPIIPIEPIEWEYPPFIWEPPEIIWSEWEWPDLPPWDINLPEIPPWVYWDFPDLPPLPPWMLPELPELLPPPPWFLPELSPWEIPDYPPMSFVGDFYYRKPYTKKDLDDLRKKCITYSKNSIEFAMVLWHNMNVLREFFNMMTDYMGTEEFNDFTDLIPPQRLKELYLDPLELNDFKGMINEFIRNTIDNNIAVNRNFKLIQGGLSDYETESDDAYFKEINSNMKTVTEDNPDVHRLKGVIDGLNQEVSSNFGNIMYNLKIVRARLL